MASSGFQEGTPFLLIAEFVPPKGIESSVYLESAHNVKDYVDLYLVPDMPEGVMRMSALGGATLLQKEGLPTVLEWHCRDRNRLALQADMLAAYALGIENFVYSTSVSPEAGDHPETQTVTDISFVDLLDISYRFKNGKDLSGSPLEGAIFLNTGIKLDSLSEENEMLKAIDETEEVLQKEISFIILPPIYEKALLDQILEDLAPRNIGIIPTVLLLKSVGMTRYIQAHNAQLLISDSLIQRLQEAENARREAIVIAREIVALCRETGCRGALVSTMGWESALPDVLRDA
jgi:5,10-methylenetetrahydrofolate reductase